MRDLRCQFGAAICEEGGVTNGERLALGFVLLEVSGMALAQGHPSGMFDVVGDAIGWLTEFVLAIYLGGSALVRIWRKSV